MHHDCLASDSATTDGTDKIALELDGRKRLAALRQIDKTAVATRGIGKADHGCCMQIAIGRKQLIMYRQA